VRKHRRDDLEAGNVGGRVHVQEDRGAAEELLNAEVEHHACRLLDAARGSGKIVEIVGPDPRAPAPTHLPCRIANIRLDPGGFPLAGIRSGRGIR